MNADENFPLSLGWQRWLEFQRSAEGEGRGEGALAEERSRRAKNLNYCSTDELHPVSRSLGGRPKVVCRSSEQREQSMPFCVLRRSSTVPSRWIMVIGCSDGCPQSPV
jgi:hypothetical protein